MAVLRMTHVGLCVADLERALRFYRDGLGFVQRSELRIGGEPTETLLGIGEVDLHAVYLERDGTRIELLHYVVPGAIGDTAPRAMNRRGLTHLSLRVDSVAEAVAALRPLGATVLESRAIDLPDFGAAAVFVTDPDGTLIELVQAPGDPEPPPGA
ncbi:MAG: VOC family protein [Deltaproteobacteria bacterium]|nr:VOC family protein [Deltaproteobacteria bacterium]